MRVPLRRDFVPVMHDLAPFFCEERPVLTRIELAVREMVGMPGVSVVESYRNSGGMQQLVREYGIFGIELTLRRDGDYGTGKPLHGADTRCVSPPCAKLRGEVGSGNRMGMCVISSFVHARQP